MLVRRRRQIGNHPARRRGAVLVLVLIVFSVLSLLTFGLCHRVRLQLKTARMRGDALRAHYLALGGINRAMAALRQNEEGEVDHFGEAWHLNTTAADEGFFEETGVGARVPMELSYATSDEEGRLNINTSSPVGWVNLPGMTESILYSILDWQDPDDSANRMGAESADYLSRAYKYSAKNAPTVMVWELALVKDVDWSLLRGEDVNGNMVLDAGREDDGPASWPMDDADGELDRGLVDFFTVYGDGKVNLNTASVEVLSALPGIEPEAAREIVAFRAGSDSQPFTSDDQFLKSFEELGKIPGVTGMQLELLEQYGTFQSSHFRIVSQVLVRPGGRPYRLTGTVRRDEEGVHLVLLRRG